MHSYSVLSYIFNGYELLHEVMEPDPEADYIMVTDDPSLRSGTWRIVLDERRGMGVMEKCYDVRFHPFRYAKTDLCVRLDSSMGINRSLRPLIGKMQEGQYDRCLLLHPYRNLMPEEYGVWIRKRGYPEEQAQRCLEAMRGIGYDMSYKGLFQGNFEIVRDNAVNRELNERTLRMLHELRTETDIERIDQTVFSAITNRFYADRLKVLPVPQEILHGNPIQWYCHHSDRPIRLNRKNVIRPMMFNRPCKVWNLLCP